MTNTALIPVFTGIINKQSEQLVNARNLHAYLGVGKVFAAWIIERIEKYGFVKNQDYVIGFPNLENQKPGRGGDRRSKDYHLTLDMAKELAMVENNEKGRQARRYFIECEKKLRAAMAQPPAPVRMPIRTRDDLSFTIRDEIGRLINWWMEEEPNENWGERFVIGQGFMDEIAELAGYDERAAYHAVQYAIAGPEFEHGPDTAFSNRGRGAECGFAEAVARAVIDGLRRRRGGDRPFNPDENPKKGRPLLPKPKRKALAAPTAKGQMEMRLNC